MDQCFNVFSIKMYTNADLLPLTVSVQYIRTNSDGSLLGRIASDWGVARFRGHLFKSRGFQGPTAPDRTVP